jgi:uncharacterized membrane protein
MSGGTESAGTAITTSRLEAFSDGVLAIIITIMVLEIRPPREPSLDSLKHLAPVLLSYLLSFTFIGIYWNNHHHLFRVTGQINAGVMWANMHLLFWLSLIPAVTIWVGQAHAESLPAAIYGLVGFMCGVAYFILVRAIIACNKRAGIARAVGDDLKGIGSVVIYAVGALLAFVDTWLAYGAYAAVSLMWFIPDRRLEEIEAVE